MFRCTSGPRDITVGRSYRCNKGHFDHTHQLCRGRKTGVNAAVQPMLSNYVNMILSSTHTVFSHNFSVEMLTVQGVFRWCVQAQTCLCDQTGFGRFQCTVTAVTCKLTFLYLSKTWWKHFSFSEQLFKGHLKWHYVIFPRQQRLCPCDAEWVTGNDRGKCLHALKQ